MNPHAEMLLALLLVLLVVEMYMEMKLDPLPFIESFIFFSVQFKKMILYLGERKYHQDKYECRVTLHHAKATLLEKLQELRILR